MSVADSPVRSEVPKSRWRTPLKYSTSCVHTGWSKPLAWAKAARCSGVADSGRYRLVGSPVSRASRNTPSSTMINGSALVYVRRRMKENMGAGLPYYWATVGVAESAGVISDSRISSPVAELGV